MHFPIISIFIKNYNSPNEHCVETQMLTLSKERFTKIQKEAPLEFQKYFVQVTKYQAAQHCKVISCLNSDSFRSPLKPNKSRETRAQIFLLLSLETFFTAPSCWGYQPQNTESWKTITNFLKKKQYSDVDYREVDDATWAVLGSIRNTFSPVCGATNYPI